MKGQKHDSSAFQLFYSRNPLKLRDDIASVRDPNRVLQIIIDYEFKKAIDYGQLSQTLLTLKAFANVQNLYLNFGQCGLNTQKLLLLMRGFSTITSRLKQVYLIFENCSNINDDGTEALIKFVQECSGNLSNLCINLKKVQAKTGRRGREGR